MGVDTGGYIPSCTPDKLLKFIKMSIDKSARLEEVEIYKGEMWNLFFQFNDENRRMSVHKIDLDEKRARQYAKSQELDYEETDHWVKVNQYKWPNNTQGVYFSLSYSGSSVFLALLFTSLLGGYVIRKDSDDDYEKVKKRDFFDYLFTNGVKNK